MVSKIVYMLFDELNTVIDSYRSTLTGRRKIYKFYRFIEIGGRRYFIGMIFNHHKEGNVIFAETVCSDFLFKTLEISIQPFKNSIKYQQKYYTHVGPSTSYLFMRNDDHIMKYLDWTPEMLKYFIDQLKLFLVEII